MNHYLSGLRSSLAFSGSPGIGDRRLESCWFSRGTPEQFSSCTVRLTFTRLGKETRTPPDLDEIHAGLACCFWGQFSGLISGCV
uniref:Uncharacterized protein n=1 Tax=Anguilla anguilla TaxID=7936 RepID=A0A0E9UB43_ANGAN